MSDNTNFVISRYSKSKIDNYIVFNLSNLFRLKNLKTYLFIYSIIALTVSVIWFFDQDGTFPYMVIAIPVFLSGIVLIYIIVRKYYMSVMRSNYELKLLAKVLLSPGDIPLEKLHESAQRYYDRNEYGLALHYMYAYLNISEEMAVAEQTQELLDNIENANDFIDCILEEWNERRAKKYSIALKNYELANENYFETISKNI